VNEVPPVWQSEQMQLALKECITAMQNAFVQRHTIITTKKSQHDLATSLGSNLAITPDQIQLHSQMDNVLDQAFVNSHD